MFAPTVPWEHMNVFLYIQHYNISGECTSDTEPEKSCWDDELIICEVYRYGANGCLRVCGCCNMVL